MSRSGEPCLDRANRHDPSLLDAHSPYQEVEFVIEDEHVVIAEFTCNLACQHGCSSDDIVVLTDTHVPPLTENLTDLYRKNEELCVILLDKLYVHEGTVVVEFPIHA